MASSSADSRPKYPDVVVTAQCPNSNTVDGIRIVPFLRRGCNREIAGGYEEKVFADRFLTGVTPDGLLATSSCSHLKTKGKDDSAQKKKAYEKIKPYFNADIITKRAGKAHNQHTNHWVPFATLWWELQLQVAQTFDTARALHEPKDINVAATVINSYARLTNGVAQTEAGCKVPAYYDTPHTVAIEADSNKELDD